MTLTGVAAYYLTAPTASHPWSKPIADRVLTDLGPLAAPILALFRLWRRPTMRVAALYP